MKLKQFLVLGLLSICAFVQAQSTSGTDFWMAFLQNADSDMNKEFYIRLTFSSQEATDVVVENEKIGYKQEFSLEANSIHCIKVPFEDFNVTEYGQVVNKSLHITSGKKISVYADNYQLATTDASIILPTAACGSYYIIQNNVSRTESIKYPFQPSFFNVVAFEDNTEVEITPTLTTTDGKPANVPFVVTLNKGDVYQVANLPADMGKGLSGSQVLVLGNKKVAVYSGNRCSNVPDECTQGDSDILYDVSYPVSSWGKKFIIRPFEDGNYDMIKCTACKNGTKIYKDGTLLTTINALESYEFFIKETDGAIKVETSEPVSTYQYMTSNNYIKRRTIGGPSYQYVAPIEQAISDLTFSTMSNSLLLAHQLNMIIKTEDVDVVTLNGKTGFTTFTPVDDVYSSATVSLPEGVYTLHSPNGFVANVYGSGKDVSYSYSCGSNIESINSIGVTGKYIVSYNGNGARTGSMLNHTYKIGVDETTLLDANTFERYYVLNFDANGGEPVLPSKVDYMFTGWSHDELLTSVTNDMASNWYNISTTLSSSTDLGLVSISNTNGVNTVLTTPEAGVRERLFSKPIYMPAGDYDLNFKYCSPSGYSNLGSSWDIKFKCAACSIPQADYGNDLGMLVSGTNKSAVLLEDYEGSDVLSERGFTVYADGTTPVYITVNCGNLEDGYPYEFKFSDFTLSKDGNSTFLYRDLEPTKNIVREDAGIVALSAQWLPVPTTLPLPVKEGFAFVGWNTKANGTGRTYNAGDPFITDADTTLYAMWTAVAIDNDALVRKPCGEGTPACPFHITTPGEMLYFASVINGDNDTIEVNEYANAILDNDIDMSKVCSAELGSWKPIGFGSSRFRGSFNGHNHVIQNLYLVSQSEGTGLFGKVTNAEFRNVIIGSGLIYSSHNSVGSIVGVGTVSMIDCHNYANIKCSNKFNGGIIGYAGTNSHIEKCHNEGNITGTSSDKTLFGVGGIAGAVSTNGLVTDCYNLGIISGQSSRVGGVVGSAENCVVTNCYSYGDVESVTNDFGGGICAIAPAYPETKVEHSYYYNSLDKKGQQPQMQRQESDFNDGTIFALLNEHTPNLWRQEEGKYPVFIDTVYVPIHYKKIYANICEGESFEFGGKMYTTPGVYISECACQGDTLVLNFTTTTITPVTLCQGDSIIFDGKVIKEAGTYSRGSGPCVSESLVVTVLSPAKTILDETISSGESYVFDGIARTESGTYTKIIKGGAENGCDSIIVLNLSVDVCAPIYSTPSETICEGSTYTLGTQLLTTSGSYTETFIAKNGCDSIVNLSLIVLPKSHTVLNEVVDIEDGKFDGYGFLVEPLALGSYTYTQNLLNQYGCDSTVVLNLNVVSSCMVNADITAHICQGEVYNLGTDEYNQTGTYVWSGKTATGCDSVVVLYLDVLPVNRESLSATVFVGDDYNDYGFSLPAQNTLGVFQYELALKNQYGCDSLVTLNLSVLPPTPVADNTIIPTVFTPYHREGKNDVFMPGYEVYIYDRYGNLVCHSTDGWDGYYRGEFADPGVYIYTIFMKDGRKKKGSIEIYK